MNNKSGKFFVRCIIYPLTLFSAFRNYNLIQTTLGDTLVFYIAGLFALVALDGGVLLWTEIAFRVDSETQDHIAKGMVIVCLVGALLGVVADTMLFVNEAAYLDTITLVVMYAIPVVIFLNLGAGFVYFLVDPENELRMEEKRIDREVRRKEKLAELNDLAAQREAKAARLELNTTAVRNATTAALLGVTGLQPSSNSNGDGPKSAMAPMAAEGSASVPKGTRKRGA